MAWVFIGIGVIFVVGGIIFLMFYYEKGVTGTQERIDDLHNKKYDPNMTRHAAAREAKASAARTEASDQIGREARSVADMFNQKTEGKASQFAYENVDARLRREEELHRQQHEHALDNLTLQRNLMAYAESNGMDVETYLEVLKTRSLNQVEMERIQEEAKAELKAGFIYQLQAYQKLNMLRDVLDGLYDRAYQIESGNEPEPVKLRKLKQVEADIVLHEEDISGRRKRLLQAFDEEEISGSDEDPDLR